MKNEKLLSVATGIVALLTYIFASEAKAQRSMTQLPEVLVESSRRNMLHVMAYVREYSQLTTYSDTVFLFREKLVDFMIPGKKAHYRGWRIPRVIKSESYYHFVDSGGLDSVSDSSRHHFSWSDWMGLPPEMPFPPNMSKNFVETDTLFGKYSPMEIWSKQKDSVSVYVNILADTLARRWVPNMKSFFQKDDVEFEGFKMQLNYDNVLGAELLRRDLQNYTYHVDAMGRGYSMFRFNNREESFYATTDAEVYFVDREYITEGEAKKWAKGKHSKEDVEIMVPPEAPPIEDDILALIERIKNMDKKAVRLAEAPDQNMKRMERNRSKGGEFLRYLKNIIGISDANAKRSQNKQWKKFRDKK